MTQFIAYLNFYSRLYLAQLGLSLSSTGIFLFIILFFWLLLPSQAIQEFPDLGIGILRAATSIALLLPINTLFQGDAEDGTLEQIILKSQSPIPYVLFRTLYYWLLIMLPITLIISTLGEHLFRLEKPNWLAAITALLSLLLMHLYAIITALLLQKRHNHTIFVTLTALPLSIPIYLLATLASQGKPEAIMALIIIQTLAFPLSLFFTAKALKEAA